MGMATNSILFNFWCIYVISNHQHLSVVESVFLMMAQGMITGAVGITLHMN